MKYKRKSGGRTGHRCLFELLHYFWVCISSKLISEFKDKMFEVKVYLFQNKNS